MMNYVEVVWSDNLLILLINDLLLIAVLELLA